MTDAVLPTDTPPPTRPNSGGRPYVAMLAPHRSGYVMHSDHPALGSMTSEVYEDPVDLHRTVAKAVEHLPDDVEVRWATGFDPDGANAEALSADNPEAAYKTVPGTERLPATDEKDPGDGLRATDADEEATDAMREKHRKGVSVVALGQVAAPNKGSTPR